IDTQTRIRVGVAFGLFEGFMPVVGLLLGASVAGYLGNAARYVGAGILVATGAYAIWQGRRAARLEAKPGTLIAVSGLGMRQLLIMALALSIDNLAVGFAIAVYNVPIFEAAVLMAAVSVAMSLVGLELGHRMGQRVEEWSEEIGGGV